MKILIVDDHAVIYLGLTRIFHDEFERPTVLPARNSQEALTALNFGRWDLMILDIDLPGRGGLDLLRQVKVEHPQMPVIIFSMHPEEQFAIRALKGGASGYVAKDSDSAQLVAAVHKVLHGGKYVSPALAERLADDLGRQHLGSAASHELLSDREFQVMRLIAAGKSTTLIADLLSLSVKTVSTYRSRILEKLGLKTSLELIRYTVDHHLEL